MPNISTEAAIAIIVASLALLGTLGTAVLSVVFLAKKSDVDVLSAIINKLRERVEYLEGMNADLEEWAERLCCQVRRAGKEPERLIRNHIWTPQSKKTRPTNKGL